MKEQLTEALKQAEIAFNKMYSETYSGVYNDIGICVKQQEETKKIMQVVYVEAYKCISADKNDENVETLLKGIVECQVESHSKKQEDMQEEKATSEDAAPVELTVEEAQEIYNVCCLAVGLTPTDILSSEEEGTLTVAKKNEKSIKEKVKGKAKKVVKDEIEGAVKEEVKKGVKKVVGGAVKGAATEEAGQVVGLIAKLAALSTRMKVVVMAGALATSAVTVGVVGTVVQNNHADESAGYVSQENTDVLDSYNVSDCLGLYYFEEGYDYSGPALLHPTKISRDTYVFYAKDIEKYFSDGDYAAFSVRENMPEELAVAYFSYGVAAGEYIPAWSDERTNAVPITDTCDIIVTVSLKEDVEKVRRNIYY